MRIENWKTTYTISIADFPSPVQGRADLYGVDKGNIQVVVKQIRYFTGNWSSVLGPQYAIGGETIVDGQTVLVDCLCSPDDYARFRSNPEGMVFELTVGETIPASWRG